MVTKWKKVVQTTKRSWNWYIKKNYKTSLRLR